VHAIIDHSTLHILQELAARVRQAFPSERHVHVVLENDDNRSRLLCAEGNAGYEAQWNDDFHHAAHVIATGDNTGYYADYAGGSDSVQSSSQLAISQLGRCLSEGFAYQGEHSVYRGKSRGESTDDLPLTAFVNFLQNHDQIGNRAFGERLSKIAQPKAVQALWEILLLAPSIPLLFMGEEWQTNKPFLFFCDFNAELASLVTEGRRKEFSTFPEFNDPETLLNIPDPSAPETFEASRLDWNQLKMPEHAEWLALCKRLLGVRRREIVPRLAGVKVNSSKPHCNVFGGSGLTVEWAFADSGILRLSANLGPESLTLAGKLLDNMDFGRHDLLYQSGEAVAKLLQSGQMPPWSVIWQVV
jgi:maltooligosyltrehalose trehalohydrolase